MQFASEGFCRKILKIISKNILTNRDFCSIIIKSLKTTRKWRNWQTRTFEGRVVHTVRVQVPFSAPKKSYHFDTAFFIHYGVMAYHHATCLRAYHQKERENRSFCISSRFSVYKNSVMMRCPKARYTRFRTDDIQPLRV